MKWVTLNLIPTQSRTAWNAGKKAGTKRPFTQKQIWAIRFYLDREGRLRDRALFDLAIDSKPRCCDLVKIRIGDLVAGADIRARAIVIQQQKTGKPVQFELTSDARASLQAWLERRGGTPDNLVFPSRVNAAHHMSTRQYARLVDEWVTAIGLRPDEYGTHSLRRTKASMIYKTTGNLRAPRSDNGLPLAICRGAAFGSQPAAKQGNHTRCNKRGSFWAGFGPSGSEVRTLRSGHSACDA